MLRQSSREQRKQNDQEADKVEGEKLSELRAKMYFFVGFFSFFAYFTGPILRNDCENRFDGMEGRRRLLTPHIIFWDSPDSTRIYLSLSACQLADFLFPSIFTFLLGVARN